MRPTQRFAMKASVLAVASALASGAAAQIVLPTGGTVAAGTADITSNSSSVAVNQTSQRAIINWTTFNISNGGTVAFTQPGTTSVAVNRVGAAAGQSTIDGILSANGHVMILNPNGVLFGQHAIVNVRGLIASTGNIDDAQFMAGSATNDLFAITGATGGSVSNAGTITLTGAGLAAFVAPSVANSGVINATSGRIRLAGAQAATISLNGGLYELAVTQGVASPSVLNTGTLNASGGNIVISALDAANVVSGVINLEGIQQASRIEVNGGQVTLKSDLNAATVVGTSTTVNVSGLGQIQDAVDIAATSATVNVAAGTYAQSKTLNVNKSITLAGAGEANTTIDSRTVTSSGGGYALQVTADNVTLRDFTLYGPAVDAGNAYGIKVQPAGSAASSRLNNFSISNVTSRGAGRAELDLNGVVGATIDHVTANGAPVGNDSGTTKGAGIQVTDSSNVTIRNSTTRNNAWGGIALYQSNRFFDQQTNNVTAEASNVLTETLPLYMQDESASKNFGALSLQGFNYAVKNSDSASGNNQYTWLQYTLGGAFDFAVNTVQPGKSSITGWNVSAADHNFYVGVGHLIAGGTQPMSVQSAIDAAAAGDLVNVSPGNYTEIASNRTLGPGVGGTYDLGLLMNKDNLTLRGVDASGNPITSAANVQAWITAGTSTNFGMNHGVVADNVTVQGLGFKPYAPSPNKTIEIAGDNFTFRNSVIDNRTADGGAGALYFGELLTNHQISRLTVTGSTFYDGSVSLQNGVGVAADGVTFQPAADRVVTNNAFIGSSNYTFGGLLFTGKMDEVPWRPLPIGAAVATGNSFSGFDESVLVRGQQQGVDLRSIMSSNTFDHAVLVTDASGNVRAGQYVSLNNVTRDKFTIQSSIQAGVNRAQSGDTVAVGAGTYAEDVTVGASRNLTFSGATIHSLTVNANSGIGGTATADGTAGFQFNAPVTLLSDTSLSTTGNRNITFSSTIDGANALSLQAGTGTITFGGNVGATTPLASLTANASSIAARSVSTVGDQSYIGALALNGASYTASNGAFSETGATTLNADTTVGSKNISFSSAVNGAKALSLLAGTGTITLGGNVGVTSLAASGSAITAQNVSTVGDQTYAGALTLNGGSYTASNGAFNATGATTLGTDTTVNGKNISFSSAVNGAKTLSLQAGSGTITLGGNVNVTSLAANGSAISAQNVSTTGDQSYTGALTLNGANYTASNGAFNATGATTLGADTTVNGKNISFSSTLNGAKALSLQAGTGTITLGGNVGVTSLAANGSAISAQNVSTTGNQSYTGAVTLNGGSYTAGNGAFSASGATTLGTDTTINGQNISFSSTVDGAKALTLQATSGAITLGGDVGVTSLAANGSTITAQNVSTSGNQSYTGAVTLNGGSYTASNGAFNASGAATLGADTIVTGKDISFSSTVNGAKTLTLQAGPGAITLGGNVSVTSLAANGSTIAAQNVSTTGNQSYTGALTLNGASYTASNGAFSAVGATTLGTDATVNGNNISFSGTINGAKALSLQAGTGTISLGGNVSVASLAANGSAITAQSVSTSGNQSYTGALTLTGGSYTASSGAFNASGATTLGTDTTVDANSIAFSSSIDGAKVLSLQSTGTVTLGGSVSVTSLTATGSTIAAQNVSTVGNQSYAGAVTLNGASYTASNGAFSVTGATTLGADTTVNGQNIGFSSTINGARTLSLQAGTGDITLGGDVGGSTRLAGLTVTGSTIATHNVSTVGDQSYTGALTFNGASYNASNGSFSATGATTLSTDTTVDTSAGNKDIAFNGDIRTVANNRYALTLNAGSGNITLTSGGTPDTPLGILTTNSGNFTLLGTLWVSGFGIDALGVVALSNHSLHAVGGGTNDVINAGTGVTGTASSAGDVAIQSGGDVTATVTATNIAINAASVSGTANAAGDVSIQSTGTVAANVSATNIAIDAVSGVTGTQTAAGGVSIQSGGNVTASVSANNIVINADQVNAVVNSPNAVEIHSPAPVNVSGSAPTLIVDAPGGSVSGNFGQVSNAGSGLLEVNGSHQAPDVIAANTSGARVLPSDNTITGNSAGNPRVSGPLGAPVAGEPGTVRASLADAPDLLQGGASVELDLSPHKERE